MAAAAKVGGGASPDAAGGAGSSEGAGARHHGLLLRLLAAELGCDPGAIVDFELNVVDTQAGVIGGGRLRWRCWGCLAWRG